MKATDVRGLIARAAAGALFERQRLHARRELPSQRVISQPEAVDGDTTLCAAAPEQVVLPIPGAGMLPLPRRRLARVRELIRLLALPWRSENLGEERERVVETDPHIHWAGEG